MCWQLPFQGWYVPHYAAHMYIRERVCIPQGAAQSNKQNTTAPSPTPAEIERDEFHASMQLKDWNVYKKYDRDFNWLVALGHNYRNSIRRPGSDAKIWFICSTKNSRILETCTAEINIIGECVTQLPGAWKDSPSSISQGAEGNFDLSRCDTWLLMRLPQSFATISRTLGVQRKCL